MYYITRFGSYNFLDGTGNPVDGTGTGGSFPRLTRTPDGWYNFRHGSKSPRDISQIPVRKLLYASPCATNAADVDRNLRAKRGTLDRLFRTWKDTPFSQEWTWASLDSFDGVESVHANSSRLFALRDVVFTMVGPYWYGQGWGDLDYSVIPYYEGQTLSAGQAASDVTYNVGGTGTGTISLTNRGNRDVLAVEVDIINLAIPSTNCTFEVTNITDSNKVHGWIYDATSGSGDPIPSGAYVTVNGANRTVRKNGTTPTYAEFTRVGANEQFLVLYPGVNTIEITVTGIGSLNTDMVFNYFDAWE